MRVPPADPRSHPRGEQGLYPGTATPVPLHDVSNRVDPPRWSTPLASFGPRAVSFLIDGVAPLVALSLLLSIAITGGGGWRLSTAAAGGLVMLGFGIWNSGYLQGTTGRSLGRRVARTRLVGAGTGQPVGFSRAVLRQICHLLEFGIGFLWPLWDGKRQTFADKIVGTVVVQTGAPTQDPAAPRLGE